MLLELIFENEKVNQHYIIKLDLNLRELFVKYYYYYINYLEVVI